MTLFEQKEQCCGCGACGSVCPKGAIEMVADRDGFLYPQIDPQSCVDCGKCAQVCPFPVIRHTKPTFDRYLTRHKDETVCNASTSGGMYTAFSDCILSQDGAIYGAAFAEDISIFHICMETAEQRDLARGSKYVQSDMTGVYASVLQQLKTGKPVLFFGTPCQVAAVLSAVPQNLQQRLYTVDLICNGVGSPRVWQQHIVRLQQRFGKRISYYWFRPKTRGYLTTSEVCQFCDGETEELRLGKNMFNSLYYNGLVHRPACHHCGYAAMDRTGDITIGDFSKIPQKFENFDASVGASTVLVNSEKGRELFALVREHIEFRAVEPEDCHQVRLNHCSPENPDREGFLRSSAQGGIDFAWKKQQGLVRRLRAWAVSLIRGVKQ